MKYVKLRGSEVKYLREELGLSQQALANEAGTSRNVIANIESNRRGTEPEVAKKVALVLEVPLKTIESRKANV